MIVTLRTQETTRAQHLREGAQVCAEQILGRLVRRVSHAVISVRECERAAGRIVHACTLRLRVPGARDVLVASLRADSGTAVADAFERARQVLIHRGRTPPRTSSWSLQPATAGR